MGNLVKLREEIGVKSKVDTGDCPQCPLFTSAIQETIQDNMQVNVQKVDTVGTKTGCSVVHISGAGKKIQQRHPYVQIIDLLRLFFQKQYCNWFNAVT